MEATLYDDGTIEYPGHPVGPGGAEPSETVDLAAYPARVLTWTTSTATPPGVREPNALAIVEFDVDGRSVRAIGGVADAPVENGDPVEPIHVDELRDPSAGIRAAESQSWDGFRFRPVDR
ncbi:OB-fold domain-containing protein [Halovivax limisalsi]|uniref:OB-fold domain-containing protein n=1 Tax=Halovivax limisalsi TaxID=1453760 RepID=UPI0031B8260B